MLSIHRPTNKNKRRERKWERERGKVPVQFAERKTKSMIKCY